MELSTITTLAAIPPKRFLTYRQTAAKILALETQLGIAPGKPILNILRANQRVSELESMVAARAKSAAPVVVAPVVEPVAEKFGREKFFAAVAIAAAAKPQAQSFPGLSGREKFTAAARVDSTPQILTAKPQPIAGGLTGRARFKAALAKDFGSK